MPLATRHPPLDTRHSIWNKSLVIERAGVNSLLYSGLDLFHTAGKQALSAARQLSSGSPDGFLDGFVSLNAARRESKIALAIVRTSRELDDTIFDIFV